MGIPANLIMSKVFYDKLVALENIDKEINKLVDSKEEKEELWHIIDEYVHHRVMGCILTNLHHDHHEEFLSRFVDTPHDEGLFNFLKEKISGDFEEFLAKEVNMIKQELMEIVKGKSAKKVSKKLKAN